MTNKHGTNTGYTGYNAGDYIYRVATQNAPILLPYMRNVSELEDINTAGLMAHVPNTSIPISLPPGLGYDDGLSLSASYRPYDDPTVAYHQRKRKNMIEDDSGLMYHHLPSDMKIPRLSTSAFRDLNSYRSVEPEFHIPTCNPISVLVPTNVAPAVDTRESSISNRGLYHVLQPLGSLPQYLGKKNTQNRAKRRCKLCSCHCSYYCEQCSDPTAGKLVCYCNPFTTAKKPCYFTHLDNLSNMSPRSFSTSSSSTKAKK